MKLLVCSIIVIVLAALQAGAQNPNLGTSGAQFLEIPAGARATAIGGAVVANSRDASALFWNPAGIVNVPSADLHLSHTTWWASMAITHAAFAFSHESFGSFGVSVAMLTVEKMEVTTELEPEGTGQFFDARDLMIGVTYARRLTEDFSVGVTAKYVNQRIWSQTASGVAFDVGTQYHVGFRDLTIAMSMSN